MLFDAPIPFDEALQSRAVKALLPTSLSSKELMDQLDAAVRERATFSAKTENEYHLQRIHDLVTELTDGKTDQATVRLRLKEALAQISYTAPEGKEGTVEDLGSDQRLMLVIQTNVEMAQGYGQWKQGQDPDVLDAFPGQELFRLEGRKEPREWLVIWQNAIGELGAATRAVRDGNQMVAPKNDPIWETISDFGVPYPPFKFNSGMWTRDLDREEALAFGIIDEATVIQPQSRGFEMEDAA